MACKIEKPAIYLGSMSYLFIVLAFVINGLASIFLKLDANISSVPGSGIWKTITSHSFFFLGIVAFALNVIFYYLALKSLPLSVAYPTMLAGTFIIVNGYASLVLNENISLLQFIGYVLIFAGASLVLLFKPEIL